MLSPQPYALPNGTLVQPFLTPQNTLVRSEDNKSLKCNYTGCSYQGTFRRLWELKGHIAAKHTKVKAFWCPVIGCTKAGSRISAFVRPDKLTDHLRAAHHDKSALAVCPAPNCAHVPLEADLLSVHIKLQHTDNKQQGVVAQMLRAISNAVSADFRRCPLQSCQKRIVLEDFSSHLLRHPCEDPSTAVTRLALEGYVVEKLQCEHERGNGGPINEPYLCGTSVVEMACPVCGSRHRDRQSLKSHIEGSHVWAGEDMTPFRQQILALIGMEAIQMLGNEVWSDVACQLTFDA